MTPEQRIRLHTWLAWLWLALTIVTTAWAVYDHEHPLLLAWLVFMSGYAIVSTHWAGREGAAPSAPAEDA
jgi:hypothetical protein